MAKPGMRPTWRGSISFGLVSVPVQLFTAVRSHDVRFRQLHEKTKAPVKQKRVDSSTGEEVGQDSIVKGYEVADGRYVVVDPGELDELSPVASRLIDIHDYVEQADIDPIYYDRAYYLAPDGETANKPYRLLAQAMERAGKVAIASFVMRNRAYLAAMRAVDGYLILSTMHYADEVADPADLPVEFVDSGKVSDREVEMAEQLIGQLATDFEPESYCDEYRDRLLQFLEAKAEGEQYEVEEAEPSEGNVVDLVAALERSLERSGGSSAAQRGDGGAGGSDRRSSTGTGDAEATPAPVYADMTRAELYELAKERDLPGRSGLSKTQLVEALTADDEASGAA